MLMLDAEGKAVLTFRKTRGNAHSRPSALVRGARLASRG